ncbi:hypothetical protein QBC35DRAFT_466415 [Podospora australis]|uniref:Conidiation-specific protein 13 n=1 Tax=Podospora australis TaxID=1536484 RepID=A0AAN6WLT9_9PEZI|nr:hypothetical protein QBC35DRAFT_466415 [Podospora australis]
MKSTFTLTLAGALVASVIAQLPILNPKWEAFPHPGVSVLSVGKDGVNGPGLNDMPLPSYTMTKRTNGLVPTPCVDIANNLNPEYDVLCPVTSVEVYDVLYSDCPIPKVICRCGNSSSVHTPDVLAQRLGRVPLKGRQLVRVLMNTVPLEPQCGAWANGADININGSCYSETQSAFLHEVGHLIDYRVGLDTSPYTQPWSGRAAFTDAIATDNCVADWYAKQSYPEAFSEMAVITAWHLYRQHYKQLNPLIENTVCLDNQFAVTIPILSEYYEPGQVGCTSAYDIPNTCVTPPCASLKTREEQQAQYPGVVFEDAEKYIQAYTKSRGGNLTDVGLQFVA